MDMMSHHDFLSWKPPLIPNLIGNPGENILMPETTMIIYGSYKSWKTMTGIHTAVTLADGRSWFGHSTMPSVVYFLSLETPWALLHERVVKYCRGNNCFPRNIYWKYEAHLKLDTSFGFASMCRDLDNIKSSYPSMPMVVIIDPLYLSLAGHINDPRDMTTFNDNMSLLKERYKCGIIILHHESKIQLDSSGKPIEKGASSSMGSSYIQNYCDTQIFAKLLNPRPQPANRVRLSFDLLRHASVLPNDFDIKWNRDNLTVSVYNKIPPASDDYGGEEDITVK